MIEKIQTLTPEEMRTIARYEAAFTDIVPLPEAYDKISDFVSVPETYTYTLEDLRTALENLIINDPSVATFGREWYYPLSLMEQEFGIDTACGRSAEKPAETDKETEPVRGLPATDEQVFATVWEGLNELWINEDDDKHVAEVPGFGEYLEEITVYLNDRRKSVANRTFTEKQMLSFIAPFEEDERVNNANGTELALCRRFTEDLIEKDSEIALRLKGYACYGGNALYACDWAASRDCMLRLYALTDDHTYANTLGYIYYYGRCTGGKPEYEKAFEMYSIAAVNGMHEGMYKLADMYSHGYACKKSPKTAKALYGIVYEDCREKFLEGIDGAFADAAIRMGSVYLNGIDEEKSAENAYAYFLQAAYAHRRRAEDSDFFGDTTVALNIQKSLQEAKALLPKDYFKPYIEAETPWPIMELLKDNYRCAVGVTRKEEGGAEIRLMRVPVHSGLTVQPLLLTLPEIDYCALTTELTMQAPGAKFSPSFETGDAYLVDYAEWNPVEQRLECFFVDTLIGWFAADTYRLYAPEKQAPAGKKLRFVSVRFKKNGRAYDYLCEDKTVKAGSTVIVPGYNGDTEATVEKIFTVYESELAIPADKYKKARKK